MEITQPSDIHTLEEGVFAGLEDFQRSHNFSFFFPNVISFVSAICERAIYTQLRTT